MIGSAHVTNAFLFVGALFCLVISFQYEAQAYAGITEGMLVLGTPMAVLMAITFNYCKVALIWVIARGSGMGSFIGTATKFLAILLSLLASMIVITQSSDQTNMAQALAEARQSVQREFRHREEHMEALFNREMTASVARFEHKRQGIRDEHQARISDYEAKRNAEMDNTFGPNRDFKGPRYREYVRLLDDEAVALKRKLADLNDAEGARQEQLFHEKSAQMDILSREREQRLSAINRDSFDGVTEAQNPVLLPLLRLVNALFGSEFTPAHLALLLSVLITLIVEFTPIALVLYAASATSRAHSSAKERVRQPSQSDPQREEPNRHDDNITPLRKTP
jgi:hypothetical protein